MWVPGSMGSFFMRFIEDSNFKPDECRITENLEWENWDRICQYLYKDHGYPYYEDYLNKHLGLLKEKYTGDDYYAAFIYVVYQLTERAVQIYGKFSDHHLWLIPLSDTYILELAESEPLFDITNLKFTHLKLHLNTKGKPIVKNLNWKTKLFCYFPENKIWLSDLLFYYKKHYYKIHKFNSNERDDWSYVLEKLVKYPTLRSGFPHSEFNDNSYININVYNLIFNNDTDQLLQVYPNFNLSDNQRTLLELVKNDIIYICNVFGLDHTLNIVQGQTNDSLKTPQMLNALAISQK